MTTPRAWCLLLLVLACGTEKEQRPPPPTLATPTAPTPTAAPASASECKERAARLDKRLHELAAANPGFMPAVHVEAPEVTAAKPIDKRGWVIAVTREGKMSIRGDQLATIQDVDDYLGTARAKALESFYEGDTGHDPNFALYIWADREAPASVVAEILSVRALEGKHIQARLLVAGKAPPPPAAKLSTEVDAIAMKMPTGDPEATKYLAEQLRGAIGACKPIIMTLGTSGLEGIPGNEAAKIANELPKGLLECDCKIPSPDLLEWGMDLWFNASAPALAWIEMPKISKGEKQPIGKLVK